MDTEPSPTDVSNDGRSRRRYISSLVGLAGALSLSGCTADDGSSPASGTPAGGESAATPTAATSPGDTAVPGLGDVVEDDRLAVVAYSVGRSDSFETLEVLNGDGHVVVDVAVQNTHEREYVGVSYRGGFTLRDGESAAYSPTVAGPEPRLDSGELAPGEVARGFLTFDRVPVDTAGLTLEVTPTTERPGASSVTIDLESGGTGPTLTHEFAVPVHDLGDTTEYRDTRFTANAVRTSMGGESTTPRPGYEFVLVDITVENTGGDELFVNTDLQADLKDAEGRTYDFATDSILAFENVAASITVDPGSGVRTEIGFEVEVGIEPLYLVMDLDDVWVGGRRFYRLR